MFVAKENSLLIISTMHIQLVRVSQNIRHAEVFESEKGQTMQANKNSCV
jgi:hypothetical protein